jgi:hypothetical protein
LAIVSIALSDAIGFPRKNASPDIARLQLQRRANVDERERPPLIVLEQPVLRVLEKAHADSIAGAAVLPIALNSISEDGEHEFPFRLQGAFSFAVIKELILREGIAEPRINFIEHFFILGLRYRSGIRQMVVDAMAHTAAHPTGPPRTEAAFQSQSMR